MTLQQLSKTVDFVQATTPSNANDGETYLDTSQSPPQLKVFDSSANAFVRPRSIQNLDAPVSNAGATQSDIANGVDSSNLSDDITSGRTRELLLLLQDKPVPEVQDPMNLQSGLSSSVVQDGDISLADGTLIDNFESGNLNVPNSNWSDWSTSIDTSAGSSADVITDAITGEYSLELFSGGSSSSIETNATDDVSDDFVFRFRFDSDTGDSGDGVEIELSDTAGGRYAGLELIYGTNDFEDFRNNVRLKSNAWSVGDVHKISVDADFTSETFDVYYDGELVGDTLPFDNSASGLGNISINNQTQSDAAFVFDDVSLGSVVGFNGYATDRFDAPTTAPADFKAWNAIRAEDGDTGGSTSPEPVEFEILDSTDTALNSTRIPKERIADEPFTMRNRVYSEDAASNGQVDYQIATTGDGGHFGIPILTVVSVKKNGSVLDSANWSFDPDTDTVTIDTSNVTIASGDTIDIKYDFDVFDSTLQPRAYLSRESTSETSPSISHFRYEYLI